MGNTQPLSSEMREGQFSRLIAWEVWNFMSIEYAKIEFDESNIINIKGYNDSGKSAMLRALDVLMFNAKPTVQTDFIQDNKEYFRVIAYFDDGVAILRDKYINGQGLYELYKDNKLLFTTKQNNMLSKITGVPEPIAEYLGLITCDAWNVNSRSCFEKQLLVETTGSENHKSLNEVLRSEEIAKAGEMLNSDKNKLNSDIQAAEQELEVYKRQIKPVRGMSAEFLKALRRHDENLDISITKSRQVGDCDVALKKLQDIPNIPKLNSIDSARLVSLNTISESLSELNGISDIPKIAIMPKDRVVTLSKLQDVTAAIAKIPEFDEIPTCDGKKIDILNKLQSNLKSLADLGDMPELTKVNVDKLNLLQKISSSLASDTKLLEEMKALDIQSKGITDKLSECQSQLKELGQHYVVCQNCGAMVSVDGQHTH